MTEIPPAVVEFMTASTSDYIRELLGDSSLINALVEPRIQQLIAAGDLVPRSRLQLGTGLELGPVGLEQAARALVAAAGAAELPEIEGFTEVLAALVAVLERIDPPALPEPATDDESTGADDVEPPIEEPKCKVCGVVVDEEQKLASQTRWRVILCAKDHASYSPKKQRKAS